MNVDDFDFELPDALIAQAPAAQRDASRMLVLPRESADCIATSFSRLADYLRPGDCLVRNNTKVIRARLHGVKEPTGAAVEALLLEARADGTWTALLKPAKRLPPGTVVALADGAGCFTVVGRDDGGLCRLDFAGADVPALLQAHGHVPLPPYMRREDTALDSDRYQTVYAAQPGAVAAPTAGLHFTTGLLAQLSAAGIELVDVTLHVGLGTFLPVTAARVEDHKMHTERFELSAAAAAQLNAAKAAGRRIVAIGTTSVRVLESSLDDSGRLMPQCGRTDLFLRPPARPRFVDGLLTNFHLPRSTLLMLVCCFAPRERVLAAYGQAVAAGFRFYSYGDCMLIL